MSDFSELCPLFETGVYKELYLGTFSGSLYFNTVTATLDFMSSAGESATAPSSFRFGRTVVVTEVYVKKNITPTTATICLYLGRRLGSGTASISIFGTICLSTGITVFPHIVRNWHAMGPTSMTLNTADVLSITNSLGGDDGGQAEIIVQYREK